MATQRLKNVKAAGWDGLVAKALKNRSCVTFLFHLFKYCLKFRACNSINVAEALSIQFLKHQAKTKDVLTIIEAFLCFQYLTKPFVVS